MRCCSRRAALPPGPRPGIPSAPRRRFAARPSGSRRSAPVREKPAVESSAALRVRLVAVQLLHLLDVVLHGVFRAHALELGPCIVLCTADEVETAGALALYIAID